VRNVGVLTPAKTYYAEVIAPKRAWEHGHKSRIGDFGVINGTMMTGLLADEILLPGEGQIRALFCVGSNPRALPRMYSRRRTHSNARRIR